MFPPAADVVDEDAVGLRASEGDHHVTLDGLAVAVEDVHTTGSHLLHSKWTACLIISLEQGVSISLLKRAYLAKAEVLLSVLRSQRDEPEGGNDD